MTRSLRGALGAQHLQASVQCLSQYLILLGTMTLMHSCVHDSQMAHRLHAPAG